VRRALATTLAAGLILVACSGGDDDNELLDLQATEEPAPEETEEPEPEETEEPEPEDPYAVPDEIDEDYVERVINAILEVRTEILRGALQQEQGENLDPDLMALHFATTEGSQRAAGLETFQGYIDDPESRGGLLPPDEMGATRFEADSLIHDEPEGCIIVVGQWDRSGISTRADNEELVIFSLSRIQDVEQVSEGNPTPWQWRDNGLMVDTDGNPIEREYWADLDYGAVLDHACSEL
jgi:hypothetical protein